VIVTTIARVPTSGLRSYELYEDVVLAILPDHGATLERRLRNADRTVDVHVIRFPDRTGYERFLQDPRRRSRRELLNVSGAAIDVHEDLEDALA
jgi:hypothetical protein